uniref:GLUG motif-containing protein n=1 Tax=Gemmiger formicilis TaxID=745368 RepID=UPI0040269431
MIHKTTRSILSVLLAALLLVTSVPLTPAFAGGGGVSLQSANSARGGLEQVDGVYQIGSADELREFAKLVNEDGETTANAILTADIDLSSVCGPELNDGTSWEPIGNSINQYRGNFNGDGHTISGLYIDSNADEQGLFGYVDPGGTVQNLSVSGSVKGKWYVGGVVGFNFSGTVTNCAFSGSVSGSGDWYVGADWYVGGVVGYNSSGTVENCHNIGEVSGNYVGGVVGYNDGGRVKNCYNTGSVSGPDSVSGSYVGGVVGWNSSDANVTNCYNTGDVSVTSGKDSDVGGVVGDNSGTVENCYNTGEVSGPDSGSDNNVGGVVGYNSDSSTVTDCYFLKQNGMNESLQGIGNDDSATGAAAVNDLSELCEKFKDDTDTWRISQSLGFPVLQDNAQDGLPPGLGTEASPYEISTADQLKNFATAVNTGSEQSAHAKLMNNINLSSVCGPALDDGSPVSWTPIGTSEESAYIGTFNGNGHKIENLYINTTDSGADNQGLFGFVGSEGTVKDLTVSGTVSGDLYVGGVVGYNSGTVTNCAFSGSVSGHWFVGGVVGYNGGSVENCYNTGAVSGSGLYVGGVVGYNSGGSTVENCYNTGSGSVSGNFVGGVVGWNDSGTVKNCYNIGEVSGTGVGGVVGENSGGSTVENCYNTGKVSGNSNQVGGVVGWNDSGTVKNCYNTGTVTGTDDYVGGVVGYNSGPVENCYNTGTVSGPDSGTGDRVGGVVGYNSGTVKNCYNTGTVTGTDDYAGGVVGLNDGNVTGCYNIGEVSGNSYVGGVVGYNDSSASVANCYYQQHDPAIFGIGGTTADDTTTVAKTAEQFASGEVAWLLENGQADGSSQVWGQNIKDGKKDNYPQLRAFDADTPQVYKVAFMNDSEEHDAKYANSGMTVGSPTTNPTKEGHTFAGWFTESSGGSQWNFNDPVNKSMTLYAQWTAVEEPIPTPTPDPTPAGPSTGDSTGWDDIRDELENAENGDEITIDMGDETKVPAEIFESLAGKDVDVTFDLGDIQWSVNGADIPTDTDFTDLDLGASLGTSGIPVNVINTITGEVGTVQITLAHNGEFGFTMTLTAPLGKENAGYWANLYHYDEDAEALNFEAAAKIDEDGSVTIPFSHASQYAIVIDTHSHATVDVSDIFIDIARDAWYKDAVQYAYDNGLMTGVSDTEFAPEATTTRAMIVSILARLEGVTTAEAAGFADVDDNDWYATAVNWAANVGVVNGYEDNTFQPNTAITREQLAAILMNYAAYKGEDVSNRADLTSYTDQPSTWAQEAMQWAVAEGLISGVTNDQLQPQSSATRAQVAAILQRLLEA